MKDDLQKSDSCGLKSEREKILTSSSCSLACLSTNLGAFCPMAVHLPSEKSIFSYFSGPRGVAILDCDSHSQAGSTSQLFKWKGQKSYHSSVLSKKSVTTKLTSSFMIMFKSGQSLGCWSRHRHVHHQIEKKSGLSFKLLFLKDICHL